MEQQGFLGDYSMLREGEGDEALLVYVDSAYDFTGYDSVWIDTVTFWHGEGTEVSAEDQQRLTDDLYLALQTKLTEKGFTIAEGPSVSTVRLRAAITEAGGAATVANAVTSIVPQTRLLATLSGLALDTAVLVGEASIEVDVRDSLSDRRVAAAVDRRVGTKAVRAAFSEWKHVTEAFDYWADRIATRLSELRAGGGS